MSDLFRAIKTAEEELETSKDSESELLGIKRVSSLNYIKTDDNSTRYLNTLSSLSNETKINKNNYPCKLNGCNKTYSQKYRLLIHQRTHVNSYF